MESEWCVIDRGGSGGFGRWPARAIAAGAEASLLIKPFKATDQSNPGLLQQVVELFRPALLLAMGRAVGQAQVLESLLIASCNAGRQCRRR